MACFRSAFNPKIVLNLLFSLVFYPKRRYIGTGNKQKLWFFRLRIILEKFDRVSITLKPYSKYEEENKSKYRKPYCVL